MKTITTFAIIIATHFMCNISFGQDKTFQEIIRKNHLAVDNGIIYGIQDLKIDSFYDNLDSIWIVDEYASSTALTLGESPQLEEVLAFEIYKKGNIEIFNRDAEFLSQGLGHLMSPMKILEEWTSEWYGDMIKALYLPLAEKQLYFYIFYCDADYSVEQLRSKFAHKQELDGLEIQLNLGSPIELENAIKNQPEFFESLMTHQKYMKVYALSTEDRFKVEASSTFMTLAGRVKKQYNSVAYGSATFYKYATGVTATSGSEFTAKSFIIPAGSYVLLTSKSTASF
ncbi:hypothetical protein H6776_02455 [Candidatus Nomurabacteria bacterium]|nr:hypothetical protein [Candidatus Nomurabacteria bacterium]